MKKIPEEECIIRQIDESYSSILTNIHKKCFPRYLEREAFTDFFSVKNTFAFIAIDSTKKDMTDAAIAMIVYRTMFEQAEILTIGTIPDYQGQGIAKILLRKAVDNCKQEGAKRLLLEVEVGNEVAIKLYKDNGFVQIDRRKLYYRQIDGTYTDALVMLKKLY
ncbi:MAG: GNAT family N-acetyltransferase [Rickettsiales bacterium]